MRCDKHKTYKGLKTTKRDCPECRKLYKIVQKRIREELNPSAPYQSITTPDKRVSLPAILAEVSCLMLYGRQPRYFWRNKGTVASHYTKVLREMLRWKSNKPEYFSTMHAIFYHTYTKFARDRLAEKVSSYQVEESKEVVDDLEEDLEEVDFKVDRKARLKRLGLSSYKE